MDTLPVQLWAVVLERCRCGLTARRLHLACAHGARGCSDWRRRFAQAVFHTHKRRSPFCAQVVAPFVPMSTTTMLGRYRHGWTIAYAAAEHSAVIEMVRWHDGRKQGPAILFQRPITARHLREILREQVEWLPALEVLAAVSTDFEGLNARALPRLSPSLRCRPYIEWYRDDVLSGNAMSFFDDGYVAKLRPLNGGGGSAGQANGRELCFARGLGQVFHIQRWAADKRHGYEEWRKANGVVYHLVPWAGSRRHGIRFREHHSAPYQVRMETFESDWRHGPSVLWQRVARCHLPGAGDDTDDDDVEWFPLSISHYQRNRRVDWHLEWDAPPLVAAAQRPSALDSPAWLQRHAFPPLPGVPFCSADATAEWFCRQVTRQTQRWPRPLRRATFYDDNRPSRQYELRAKKTVFVTFHRETGAALSRTTLRLDHHQASDNPLVDMMATIEPIYTPGSFAVPAPE